MSDDPAYYEGLGRAIKVARTERGLSRRDLADAAGVSYAYLSDIETGRGRPGSRSFLAIAEAMLLSPSTLMREAERYRAQIGGEEAPAAVAAAGAGGPASGRDPGEDGPHERGRAVAGSAEVVPRRTDARRGRAGSGGGGGTVTPPRAGRVLRAFCGSREELHRLVDELSPEDAEVVLALVRRLRSGRE